MKEWDSMQRLADTLYIVGVGHYGDEDDVPWDSPDSEKWGISGTLYKKNEDELVNTRCIEVHTLHTRPKEILDFLFTTNLEVVAQENFPSIKYTIKYPLQEMIDHYKTRYFTCSFSYMLALAHYMGYKKIILRGINMLFEGDIQKYSMEFWLGIMHMTDTEVEISDCCDILRCEHLYGFEAVNTPAVCQLRLLDTLNGQMQDKIKIIQDESRELARIHDLIEGNKVLFTKEIMARHGITPYNWSSEDYV